MKLLIFLIIYLKHVNQLWIIGCCFVIHFIIFTLILELINCMRKKILLLGSGELGKEFVIACQRLGQYVIAVDSYQELLLCKWLTKMKLSICLMEMN